MQSGRRAKERPGEELARAPFGVQQRLSLTLSAPPASPGRPPPGEGAEPTGQNRRALRWPRLPTCPHATQGGEPAPLSVGSRLLDTLHPVTSVPFAAKAI